MWLLVFQSTQRNTTSSGAVQFTSVKENIWLSLGITASSSLPQPTASVYDRISTTNSSSNLYYFYRCIRLNFVYIRQHRIFFYNFEIYFFKLLLVITKQFHSCQDYCKKLVLTSNSSTFSWMLHVFLQLIYYYINLYLESSEEKFQALIVYITVSVAVSSIAVVLLLAICFCRSGKRKKGKFYITPI